MICLRHSFRSTAGENFKSFLNSPVFLHLCATRSELLSKRVPLLWLYEYRSSVGAGSRVASGRAPRGWRSGSATSSRCSPLLCRACSCPPHPGLYLMDCVANPDLHVFLLAVGSGYAVLKEQADGYEFILFFSVCSA